MVLQQMLKNVALLTRYSQCTGRTCDLLSGVLAWKLLKSHGTPNTNLFIMKREFVNKS